MNPISVSQRPQSGAAGGGLTDVTWQRWPIAMSVKLPENADPGSVAGVVTPVLDTSAGRKKARIAAMGMVEQF